MAQFLMFEEVEHGSTKSAGPVQIQLRGTLARPSDYRLVVRLCRRAVGPRDYAVHRLREAISDRGLFLAWNGQELVGMTNFEKCIDGTGWMSMARTDPDWRRRGVALFLQTKIATYAKRNAVRTLRLWTSSRNKPSIRACMKGGFRPVCEASAIFQNIPHSPRTKQRPNLNSFSKRSLEGFLKSRYLSKMNGYLGYKWHFLKADNKLLGMLLRRGELYSLGGSAFILTNPEKWHGKLDCSFTLIHGPTAKALRAVKNVAKNLGANVISSYIPYDRYRQNVAKALGFRVPHWGRHCIVFEKKLS